MTIPCLTRKPISGDPCYGTCAVHRVWMHGQWYYYPIQVPIIKAVAWSMSDGPIGTVDRPSPIVVVHCGPSAHLPHRPNVIPKPRQITQRWPTLKMSDPFYLAYVKAMTQYTHDVYAHLYEVQDRPDGYSTLIWKVWDR